MVREQGSPPLELDPLLVEDNEVAHLPRKISGEMGLTR